MSVIEIVNYKTKCIIPKCGVIHVMQCSSVVAAVRVEILFLGVRLVQKARKICCAVCRPNFSRSSQFQVFLPVAGRQNTRLSVSY